MYAILELGVGQLQIWQDEADVSESLPGTKYSDLDALFGWLGISRLPSELYSYDPYVDQLNTVQWNEVTTKDALFRLRIMKFLQSMLRGGTLEGIQMMAEAACGEQAQVFEMWRVISGHGLATGLDIGRDPQLELGKEFVIIPLADIDDNQRAAIIHLVELIKPVNTIATVHDSPVIPLDDIEYPFTASEDYFFTVKKMVTAGDELLFNDPDIWIQPNSEVEGPTFAGMATHDDSWSLNSAVSSIQSYRVDEQFMVVFATCTGGINSSVTSMTADEADQPSAPSFPIKIDDEELFVTERTPVVGSDTQYTYLVLRGQNGTTAASHANGAPVSNGSVAVYDDTVAYNAQFGPWRTIPTADSPDNFPEGQFPGDPAKYDTNGNYVYDYASQTSYVAWYTLQIQSLGGEITGTQYRLPLTIDSISSAGSSPENALAPLDFNIRRRIYPSRN